MTNDRMFMILLFIISITALIVGGIALNNDDRDIVIDETSELNGSLAAVPKSRISIGRSTCHIVTSTCGNLDPNDFPRCQGVVKHYSRSGSQLTLCKTFY